MLMRTFSLLILSLLFFSALAHSESLAETPSFVLPEEISFKRDVMPVFMKAGCNAGDCHGSSRGQDGFCLLYTSPSPRDVEESRMPSSA